MAATKEQKHKYEQKRAKRSRSWTWIVYPNSAPKDWKEKLDEEHIPWVCSPLHDSDVNADGKPKKPHWHVMILLSAMKTLEQVKELVSLTAGTVPQTVKDRRAMTRYFVHMDNPEKAQYALDALEEHGGADVKSDLLSATDKYAAIAEMMDFVDRTGVTELYELLQYARTYRMSDWFPLLCDSCAYIMTQYIKSRHYAAKDAQEAEDKAFEAEKRKREAALPPKKDKKDGGMGVD